MTPTAPQSRYYQQHSMATTGWWSWLVIHTSYINPQNLFKRWILLILLPFMLVIQKKNTKSSHSMINRAQGQSNSLWMKSSISTYFDHDFPIVLSPKVDPWWPRRLACPPARLGCTCSRPRSRHKESPSSLRHFTPGWTCRNLWGILWLFLTFLGDESSEMFWFT